MTATFLRQYGAFLAVSGIAALVNLVARVAFSRFVIYEIAVALAFPIALTVAYILNRRYVFPNSDGNTRRQYVRFALVNLLALVQVWGISVGLLRLVFPAVGFEWHVELIAHAVGVASPAITSYFAHKYYSFKS